MYILYTNKQKNEIHTAIIKNPVTVLNYNEDFVGLFKAL